MSYSHNSTLTTTKINGYRISQFFWLVLLLFAAGAPVDVSAKTVTWIGGGADTNWATPENWDQTLVSGDAVIIPAGVATTTIISDPAVVISSLVLENTSVMVLSGALLTVEGPITLTGSTIVGDGALALHGDVTTLISPNPSALSIAEVLLGGADRSFTVGNGPAYTDFTLASRVKDGGAPAGIIVNSLAVYQGRFDITGSNTFTGTTRVKSNSIVWVGNPLGLGAASGGTVVESGGSLAITTADPIAEPLELHGAGYLGWGALIGVYVDATWSGSVVIPDASAIDVSANNNLQLTGTLSGSGALTAGIFRTHTGTIVLTQNETLPALTVAYSPVAVATGATLTVAGDVTLQGGIITGGGALALQRDVVVATSSASAVLNVAQVFLSSGRHDFIIGNGMAEQDLIINSNLTTTGGNATVVSLGGGVLSSPAVSSNVVFQTAEALALALATTAASTIPPAGGSGGWLTATLADSGLSSNTMVTTTAIVVPLVSDTIVALPTTTFREPISVGGGVTQDDAAVTSSSVGLLVPIPLNKIEVVVTSTLDVLLSVTRFGERHEFVRMLQVQLQEAGYFSAEQRPTNFYGPITAQAVRRYFMSKPGLIIRELPFVLQSGDRGPLVHQLQMFLKQQGYFPSAVPATGWYGPITAWAALRYQAQLGL